MGAEYWDDRTDEYEERIDLKMKSDKRKNKLDITETINISVPGEYVFGESNGRNIIDFSVFVSVEHLVGLRDELNDLIKKLEEEGYYKTNVSKKKV